MGALPHDRSHLLCDDLDRGLYSELFKESVDKWLISHLNDDRASDSSEGLFVTSVAVAKSNGVLAGRFPVDRLIERFFNSCSVDWVVEEGQRVSSGQELLSLKGPSSSVLSCERVLLNILGRMSGIASSTAEWISESEGIAVACTRKTAWGLMDKWAVHVGGGLTHRLSRSDALMIKENDLMVLEPEKDSVSAIRSVISSIDFELHSPFTVLEVSELEQATAAAKSWSEEQNQRGSEDRIVLLLDNMGPRACGEVDEELRSMNLRNWCILEGSGGIVRGGLPDWASISGVDLVSSSEVNMAARSMDISMIIGGR